MMKIVNSSARKAGIFSVGFIFYLLVLCLTGHAQQKEKLIVPGKSIGRVFVGRVSGDVIKRLGEAAEGDAALGREGWIYFSDAKKSERLEIHLHRDIEGHRYYVESIGVTSPDFVTQRGVSTASSVEAIWKAFPTLTFSDFKQGPSGEQLEQYFDFPHGMQVTFRAPKAGQKRKCYMITVFEAYSPKDMLEYYKSQ